MVIIVLGVVLLISFVIFWGLRTKSKVERDEGKDMHGLVIYDEHGRETLNTSDRTFKVRGVFTVPKYSSITRNITFNTGEQIVLLPSWLVVNPSTNPSASNDSKWDYTVNGNTITLINKHAFPLHFIVGTM